MIKMTFEIKVHNDVANCFIYLENTETTFMRLIMHSVNGFNVNGIRNFSTKCDIIAIPLTVMEQVLNTYIMRHMLDNKVADLFKTDGTRGRRIKWYGQHFICFNTRLYLFLKDIPMHDADDVYASSLLQTLCTAKIIRMDMIKQVNNTAVKKFVFIK